MKKLIALVLVLSLQGCMWQKTNGDAIVFMQEYCKDRGSTLRSVVSYVSGTIDFSCENIPDGFNLSRSYEEFSINSAHNKKGG